MLQHNTRRALIDILRSGRAFAAANPIDLLADIKRWSWGFPTSWYLETKQNHTKSGYTIMGNSWWLVEPTLLKNVTQNGNLPQIGVKINIFETTIPGTVIPFNFPLPSASRKWRTIASTRLYPQYPQPSRWSDGGCYYFATIPASTVSATLASGCGVACSWHAHVA